MINCPFKPGQLYEFTFSLDSMMHTFVGCVHSQYYPMITVERNHPYVTGIFTYNLLGPHFMYAKEVDQ